MSPRRAAVESLRSDRPMSSQLSSLNNGCLAYSAQLWADRCFPFMVESHEAIDTIRIAMKSAALEVP
jgi:hypothetical protein